MLIRVYVEHCGLNCTQANLCAFRPCKGTLQRVSHVFDKR